MSFIISVYSVVAGQMLTLLYVSSCAMAHDGCIGLNSRERGLMVDGLKDRTWNVWPSSYV